jgi:hypothetical protein
MYVALMKKHAVSVCANQADCDRPCNAIRVAVDIDFLASLLYLSPSFFLQISFTTKLDDCPPAIMMFDCVLPWAKTEGFV